MQTKTWVIALACVITAFLFCRCWVEPFGSDPGWLIPTVGKSSLKRGVSSPVVVPFSPIRIRLMAPMVQRNLFFCLEGSFRVLDLTG